METQGLLGLIVFLTVTVVLGWVILMIMLIVFVAEMAQRQGRSKTGWVLASLLISPLLVMIILKCIGDTEEFMRERWRQRDLARIALERRLQKNEDIDKEIEYLTQRSPRAINFWKGDVV